MIPLTRICNRCKVKYPLTNEYFCVNKYARYGLHTYCKKCKNELASESYFQEDVRQERLSYQKKYNKVPENQKRHQEREKERRKSDPSLRMYCNGHSLISNWLNKDMKLSLALCEVTNQPIEVLRIWKHFYQTQCEKAKEHLETHMFIPGMWFPNLAEREQYQTAFNLKNIMFVTHTEHLYLDKLVNQYKEATIQYLQKRFPGN